jgi:hypothetical protein
MDNLEQIVAQAIATALAGVKAPKATKSTKGKVTCEKVTDVNRKAEEKGFPTLLTTSSAVAKRNNFKTTKGGEHFTCRDCGAICRTYGVLMNHYRMQKGKAVKAKA